MSGIRMDVDFNVKQQGLTGAISQLQKIQSESTKALSGGNGNNDQLQSQITQAEKLKNVLLEAYNPKTNQLSLGNLATQIKDSYGSVQQFKAAFQSLGSEGSAAYRKLSNEIISTGKQVKEVNTVTSDLFKTFMNAAKYTAANRAIFEMASQISNAYSYVKQLDSSLNDIRIVTGNSADEMERFASSANKAAQNLGKSTLDYTKASLIYYQQGLSDEEVKQRTETTLKTSNVTGQSASAVSEELTAVWNGFKVTAEETETYVDKMAAVAATSASDLEELSTAMSKVASSANSMGVDIDQISAQISTIISTTRQAPEAVGTALKTIYARLGDLKIDGVDEFGTTLGEVSSQLADIGIQVTDEQGNLRDMGTVIEEVGEKWQGWTEAQKQAVAVAMAGKRQYNNLIALFDNWDQYNKELEISQNAVGTLQDQQDIYMESTEAHLQKLQTTAQEVYKTLFNSKEINGFLDIAQVGLRGLSDTLKALGGSEGGLSNWVGILSIVGKFFKGQLADQITLIQRNKQIQASEQARVNFQKQLAQQRISELDTSTKVGEAEKKRLETQVELLDYQSKMSEEEYAEAKTAVDKVTQYQEEARAIEEAAQAGREYLSTLAEVTRDESSGTGAKEAEAATKSFKGLTEEIQRTYKAIDMAKEGLKGIRKFDEFEGAERNITKFDDKMADVSIKLESLKGVLNAMEMPEGITKAPEELEVAWQALTNDIIGYRQILEETGKEESFENDIIQQRDALYDAILIYLEELEKLEKESLENEEKSIQATESLRQAEAGVVEKKLDQAEAERKNLDLIIQQAKESSKIAGIISGFTDITMGISGIKGVVEGFQDLGESLDEGNYDEAIDNLVSIGMSIRFVTPLIEKIETGFAGLTGALGTLTAETTLAEGAATGLTGLLGGLGIEATVTASALTGIILPIAGIAAGVIALGAAFYSAYQYEQRFQRFSDDMQEASQTMSETASAAKDNYDELLSSIESYETAREALSELTVGTQEWHSAVLELNQQVLELMQNYPSLAKEISNINGVLTISNTGLDDLLKHQEESVQNAQNAQLAVQMASASANNDLLIHNAGKEKVSYNLQNEEVLGYRTSGNVTSSLGDDVVKSLLEDYRQTNGEILNDEEALISKYGESLAKTIMDPANDIVGMMSELDTQIAANNEIEKQNGQLYAQGALEGKYDYDSSDYQEGIAAVLGNTLANSETREAITKKVGELTKDDYADFGADLFGDEYASAAYDSSDQMVHFYNALGEEIGAVTQEAIATGIIAEEAANNLDIDSYNRIFDQLTKIYDLDQRAVADILSGEDKIDFSNVGESSLESIAEDGQAFWDSLTESQREAIRDAYGDMDDSEIIAIFEDSANQILEGANDAFSTLPSALRQLLQDIPIDDLNMSAGTKNVWAKALRNAYNDTSAGTNQMMENVANITDIFANNGDFLNRIDWEAYDLSSEEGLAALEARLEEVGVTGSDLELIMQYVADATEEAGTALENFTTRMQKIASGVHDLSDTEIGAEIDDDQYSLIEEYADAMGVSIDDLVMTMSDGRKILQEDGTALAEAIQDWQTQSGIDEIRNKANAIDFFNQPANADISTSVGKTTDYQLQQAQYILGAGDYLDLSDTGINLDDIEAWTSKLEQGLSISDEHAKELASDVEKVRNILDEQGGTSGMKEELEQMKESIAESVTDLDQLDSLHDNGVITDEQFSGNMKRAGIEELEISGVEDANEAYERYLDIATDVLSKDKKLAKNKEELARACNRQAVADAKLEQGVTDVYEAMEDLEDSDKAAIKSGQSLNKVLATQPKLYNQIKKGLSNITGIDVSDLSDEFVNSSETASLLAKAVDGDTDAISRLREASVDPINWDADAIDAAVKATGLSLDELSSKFNQLQDLDLPLNTLITDMDNLAARTGMSANQILGALTDMANAYTAMGQDAEEALLAAGWDAEIVTDEDKTLDTSESIGWDANVSSTPISGGWAMTIPQVSTNMDKDGNMTSTVSSSSAAGKIIGSFPQIHTTPQKQTADAEKENTTHAVKVKNAKKVDTGGHISGARGSGGGRSGGSGGGGGGRCFAPGTLIALPNAKQDKIENIKIGDKVLSYNVARDQIEVSLVLQTMVHDTIEPMYHLFVEDDELIVTGIHKFFILREKEEKWLPASEIQIGDLVLFANRDRKPIKDIQIKEESLTVYNFEVSGNHNYFVGKNLILTHNKGGGSGSSKKPTETKKTSRNRQAFVKQTNKYQAAQNAFTKYQHTKDKAAGGKKYINALTKENNLIDKQIASLKELMRVEQKRAKNPDASASLQGLKKTMRKYAKTAGKKPKYDSDGWIMNYAEIETALYKRVKKTSSTSKARKKANKNYEKFEEAFESYQDLLQTVFDQQEELENLKQQKIENNLEKFEYKITYAADFSEVKRALADFNQSLKETYKSLYSGFTNFGSLVETNLEKIQSYGINDKGKINSNISVDLGVNRWVTRRRNSSKKNENTYTSTTKVNGKAATRKKTDSELKKDQKNLDNANDKIRKLRQKKKRLSKKKKKTKKDKKWLANYKKKMTAAKKVRDAAKKEAKKKTTKYRSASDLKKDKSYQKLLKNIKRTRSKIKSLQKLKKLLKKKESGKKLTKKEKKTLQKLEKKLKKAGKSAKEIATAIANARKTLKKQKKKKENKKRVKTYIEIYKEYTSSTERESPLKALTTQFNKLRKAYQSGKLSKIQALGFNNMEEAENKLLELMEEIKEAETELKTYAQEVWEAYYELISDAIDMQEQFCESLETTVSLLESQKSAYTLAYGENDYAGLNKILEAQMETQTQLTNSYKTNAKYAKENFEGLDDTKNMGWTLDEWGHIIDAQGNLVGDAYKNMTQEQKLWYDSYVSNLTSASEAAVEEMEYIKEYYENQMKMVQKEMEDTFTDGWGSDFFNILWDQTLNDISSKYDQTQSLVKTQTLANKYDKLIESYNNKNLKTQQKLQAIREQEIDALKEKKNLTQYDVEAAEKRYEIYAKQVALEDAQNAKNSMKMVRNNQGNWTYQYVADQSAVEDAQQDLLTATSDYYDLTKNHYQELLQSQKDLNDTYLSNVQSLDSTDEQYEAKLEKLKENYIKQSQEIEEQLVQAREDLNEASILTNYELYQTDTENLENMSEEQKDIILGIKEEGLDAITSIINSTEDMRSAWEEALIKSDNSMASLLDDLTDKTKGLFEIGEDSLTSWNTKLVNIATTVKKQLVAAFEDLSKSLETLVGDGTTENPGLIAGTTSALDALNNAITNGSTTAAGEASAGLEDSRASAESVESITENAVTNAENAIDDGTDTKLGSTKSLMVNQADTKGLTGQIPVGKTVIKGEKTSAKIAATKKNPKKRPFKVLKWDKSHYKNYNFQIQLTDGNNPKYWATAAQIKKFISLSGGKQWGFDTGGYTGDWGSNDGKLALLHQKELVLNKDDTENILKVVDTVKELNNIIDNGLQGTLAEIGTKILLGLENSFNTIPVVSKETQEKYQINIDKVDFPNAENTQEIKEAILSLPQLAAQYVNQNRK